MNRNQNIDICVEMAVIQLQRDVEDCRTELELARKHTPAVALRSLRRSGFTSTPVPRYSGNIISDSVIVYIRKTAKHTGRQVRTR